MQALNPYKTVLENGMVVILAENHNAPVASIQIFVKVGSAYEGKYLGTGISHFIEHVVDDGTHGRSRQIIDELVEYIGNISNAYTCKNHTKYYITTSMVDFDLALDVISDYIQNATFPASEVEIQRGVILSEFNQDADEPYRRLHDLYYETAYQKHPIRYPAGGYRESFEKLTRDDLVDFYVQNYVPENVIFVAVGDFGIQETLDKVKTAFKDFKRRHAPRYVLPQEPKQIDMRRVQGYADVEITYMLIGFHTTDILNEDAYVLDLIVSILGDGSHSRLEIAVKNRQQLVHSIDSWSEFPDYNLGLFMIEAELEKEYLELAENAVLQELYRLKTEPVSDTELQRAKSMEESAHIFARQTAADYASILGMNEFMTSEINFIERYLEKFKSVTAIDIMRVANKYFNPENMSIAAIIPRRGTKKEYFDSIGVDAQLYCRNIENNQTLFVKGKGESSSPFLLSFSDSHKNAEAKMENLSRTEKSAPTVFFPHASSPKKIEFENGIRLLVDENHSMPIVSIQALFLGGVFFETENSNGICNFMANMLIKGTRQRTALQIMEQIESIGGAIDVFSGNHSFGCIINLLNKDFRLGLDILSDVIQSPTFKVEEFEIQRREIIAEIKADDDDLISAAQKLFLKTMFPQVNNTKPHPYGFKYLGTPNTILRLGREEVIAFYRQHCISNNMVLAIFGDIDRDEAIDSASIHFSTMPKGGNVIHSIFSGALNHPYLLNENLPGVIRVEKIKAISQSVLFIGYPGVTIFHPDSNAMQVLEGILSGIGYPGGRLHNRLRHDKYVYLIHAYNLFGLDIGYLAIYASTTAEMLEAVLAVIDEEIADLGEHGVSPRELERGKRMCIFNHRLSMQTISEQAFNIGINELYERGYDYPLHYESEINSVTTADIKRVAKQYLNPERRVITVLKPGISY